MAPKRKKGKSSSGSTDYTPKRSQVSYLENAAGNYALSKSSGIEDRSQQYYDGKLDTPVDLADDGRKMQLKDYADTWAKVGLSSLSAKRLGEGRKSAKKKPKRRTASKSE